MPPFYVALERFISWVQLNSDEHGPPKWIAPLYLFVMDEETGYALDFDSSQDSSTKIPSQGLQRLIVRAIDWTERHPKVVIRCDRRLHEDLIYTLRKCHVSKKKREQIQFVPMDQRPPIVLSVIDSVFSKAAVLSESTGCACDQCIEEKQLPANLRASLPSGPCRCRGIISVLDGLDAPKRDLVFQRLYAAAARFYRTKAWLHLRISHTLRLEVPALSKKPRYVTVIGGAGQCDLGLWVCDDWKNVQHARFFDELGPDQVLRGLRVNFSTVRYESSLADLAYIEKHAGEIEVLDPDSDLYEQAVYPVFCEVHMQFPGPMQYIGEESFTKKLIYSQHIAKLEDLQWLYLGLNAAAAALEKKLFMPVQGNMSTGDFRVYHSFEDEPLSLPNLMAKDSEESFNAQVSFPPLKDRSLLPSDHFRTIGPPKPKGCEKCAGKCATEHQGPTEEAQQVLYEAMRLKATGNDAYRSGRFEEAFELYSRTLGAIPAPEEEQEYDEQYSFSYRNVLANRAMAAVKLKRWHQVVEDCGKVVKSPVVCSNPDIYTMRCLSARGQAFEALGKFMLAKYDYEGMILLKGEAQFALRAKKGIARVEKALEKNTVRARWTKLKTSRAFGRHMFHSTVLHPDGKHLVVYGGRNDGSLTPGFPMNDAVDTNYVYLVNVLDGAEKKEWKKVKCSGRPPSKSGLANHSAVIFNRQMVVFGGQIGDIGMFDDPKRDQLGDDVALFSLDLDTYAWSIIRPAKKSPKPRVRFRCSHTAVMVESKMYVFGGVDESSLLECFDFEKQVWSVAQTKGKLAPGARNGHMSWAWGNQLVVLGGEYNGEAIFTAEYYTDMWIYDIKAQAWTELKQGGPLYGCAETQAAVIGAGKTDVVVVFGGFMVTSSGSRYISCGMGVQQSRSNSNKCVHRLLVSEDARCQPVPRAGCTLTAVGNRMYMIGGYLSYENRIYDDVWSMKLVGKKK